MQEFPRTAEMLERLLYFVDYPKEEETKTKDILALIIEKVTNDVANYCNVRIDKLPESIDTTIFSIIIDYVNTHNVLPSQTDEDDRLQSLTEGDVSYTFRSKGQLYQQLYAVNLITDNYNHLLKGYRRLPFNNEIAR